MKISFLNSCLEPGRDGVGDYTYTLAQECVRQGHECNLIALSDRFVSEAKLEVLDSGITQLRIPTTMPWSKRIIQAEMLSKNFEPDWISLQFVPYAFHPKGTVFGLARKLRPLFANHRSHVMFHETWIGELMGASVKHRIVGAIQKRLVLNLIRHLAPQVAHSSNVAYQNMLTRHGIHTRLLPLFGSIPIDIGTGNNWLLAELRKVGIDITEANRQKFWLAGFFGSMPADWQPEPVFDILRQAADCQGRRLIFLSVGRLGAGEALWTQLSEDYASEFTFYKIGFQPTDRISQFLNSLDFGMATTDYNRIGKSSVVATMLEHGLPVIINQDNERFRTGTALQDDNEPLLYKLDRLQNCIAFGLERQPAQARLPYIASQFIHDLQNV